MSSIESCADHIHWAGGDWTTARGGAVHSDAGGGHAHVGAMIYLGDNWPDSYRNSIYMCNLHGSRINHDTLDHKGSGYISHHDRDFLLANDPWFRGTSISLTDPTAASTSAIGPTPANVIIMPRSIAPMAGSTR